MADQAVERRLRVAAARFAAERRSAGPLDRYAPRCGNFVLVVPRIAVLGARSAPKRYWQPAKGSAGISRGGAPWLVRAARRAEALRAAADRLRALVRACRASCAFDAAACPSRFSARSVARDRAADWLLPSAAALAERPLGRATRPRRGRSLPGRGQVDASLARLGEPDRNRLLRRSCAVFAFPNVLDLLAHELAGLCRRGPAGAFCLTSPFECGLPWHEALPTQVAGRPCFSH